MSRNTAIYFHIVLSGLILLAILYGATMIIIRIAHLGIKEALPLSSMPDGYGGLVFFGYIVGVFMYSYPVVLNIWGWRVINQGKEHNYLIFLYPFLGSRAVTVCFTVIMVLLMKLFKN